MLVLLQFDLFYTIIKIPDRFENLFQIQHEFRIWVYNCEDCREYFDDNNYGVIFDDDTFINWFKKYKLEPNETVEIIKSNIIGKPTKKDKYDILINF